MPKRLMPYGSKQHGSLIVKDGGKEKLADRLSAQLAGDALASTGGHLTKGGTPGGGKRVVRQGGTSRIVRLNSGRV